MENQGIIESMREFLSGQVGDYRKILQLSLAQQDYIQERDTQELMKVLAEKQGLIRIVDERSSAAAPLLKSWEGCRDEYSREERQSLEELHRELVTVLGELTELEEQGKQKLNNSMGSKSQVIARMQTGKQMLKAYGVRPPQDGRFTDKKR